MFHSPLCKYRLTVTANLAWWQLVSYSVNAIAKVRFQITLSQLKFQTEFKKKKKKDTQINSLQALEQ